MREVKSVIGLDPGSEKSAFIHWDGKEILDKGIQPNERLLNLLSGVFRHQFKSTTIAPVLAVESMVHITMGGKSIVDTLLWAGRFYQAWQGEKEFVPVHVIKKALGKNDSEIRISLIRRFGAPGNAKHPGFTYELRKEGYHLWRAFAVAVVWHDHLELQGSALKSN